MDKEIINEISNLSDLDKILVYLRFFKTTKGQYGEGDKFLGVTVPKVRKIAQKYCREINLSEVQNLMSNEYHEIRLVALIILTYQFEKSDNLYKSQIYDFYLKNTKNINNWDLVDVSAYKVVGEYLRINRIEDEILNKLAISKILWERRISIVSTLAFIKNNEFNKTIEISTFLLKDTHDLIHKAVGWMLREVGKRNKTLLIDFLDKYYLEMPRTMLRYAIEKLDNQKRSYYLYTKSG